MNSMELQREFDALLQCHSLMLDECRTLVERDASDLQRFFRGCDSLNARQQLWEHGDGYILRGLPKDISALDNADALVLVVWSFPLLSQRSVFDRFVPLTSIDYWTDTKRLENSVEVSGQRLALHFMVWQQDCSFHGECISHARSNRTLLWGHASDFQGLCMDEAIQAARFLYLCRDSLQSKGKPMLILTGRQPASLDDLLQPLLEGTVYVRESLRGRNYGVMDRLARELRDV